MSIPVNVLVVGSGAREHAIAWKLRGSPKLENLYVAPGNAGTASIGRNLPGSPEDLEGLADAAKAHRVDVTIVGPEVPLARGIVDLFGQRALTIFGPAKAAARIEASKAFAKELMRRHGIPTPEFRVFHSYAEAHTFLSRHQGPVVVKADGLAAGKGVAICEGREDAIAALDACMRARAFGDAGETVVVEEWLAGREVSVFAFCDGEHLSPMVAACDYKRLMDGDVGPNTGGMGSYSPPEFWTPELEESIRRDIMAPTVRALCEEEAPYRGVLYAGLMLTSQGPTVLEFNCRLGDPETQVVLPLLDTDLLDVVVASLQGRVDSLAVEWRREACVGVVGASGGYPSGYGTGFPIGGLEDVDADVHVFHAGTRLAGSGDGCQVLTDGGRVLTVAACGPTLGEARRRAYENIGKVNFQAMHYRRDIALLR